MNTVCRIPYANYLKRFSSRTSGGRKLDNPGSPGKWLLKQKRLQTVVCGSQNSKWLTKILAFNISLETSEGPIVKILVLN